MPTSLPETAAHWQYAHRALGHRFRKRRLWTTVIKPMMMRKVWASTKQVIRPKSLLLVRFDRIGDYVLFRNFLADLRESVLYGDFHITLCGNSVFRNLAETLDRHLVDRFIWVDRDRFLKQRSYHLEVLAEIYRSGFTTAVQPAYSREIHGDLLVFASQAEERIGVDGDPTPQRQCQKEKTDSFYTRLISVDPRPKFEFNRNREIMESLLAKKLGREKAELALPNDMTLPLPEGDYAVIVPGASSPYKVWPEFGAVVEYLSKRYGLTSAVVGRGQADRESIKRQFTPAQSKAVVNLCDRTTLVELAFLLKNAKIVISNDTGAVHIAAALGRPTICLTSGTNAFRFNHYPAEFDRRLRFLFPPEIEEIKESAEFENYTAEYSHNYDIRKISVERVYRTIDELLSHE